MTFFFQPTYKNFPLSWGEPPGAVQPCGCTIPQPPSARMAQTSLGTDPAVGWRVRTGTGTWHWWREGTEVLSLSSLSSLGKPRLDEVDWVCWPMFFCCWSKQKSKKTRKKCKFAIGKYENFKSLNALHHPIKRVEACKVGLRWMEAFQQGKCVL